MERFLSEKLQRMFWDLCVIVKIIQSKPFFNLVRDELTKKQNLKTYFCFDINPFLQHK